MASTIQKAEYLSVNQKNKISYYIWSPQEGPIKGIVQISHGMCEYVFRYNDFANFLCDNGFIVCGNDHLGHGASVLPGDPMGFFDYEGGHNLLSQDLKILTDLVKSRYGGLPYFLLGHSMGSFVARDYMSKFAYELDGVLLSGTAGPNLLADIGISIAENQISTKGPKAKSPKLDHLFFGGYNKKIRSPRTKFDWLSRDESVVEKYIQDPWCGYLFTTTGYRDEALLLKKVNHSMWAKTVPSHLPVFLFSGNQDPVGGYGKGVTKVYHQLKRAGVADITLKLYEGGRHEMLNETNRQDVYLDVLDWLTNHLPSPAAPADIPASF
ncbi:alpha/beta fold hydrolase [Zongyangia hominis]|uniref:Alpha/beta hydrolase n=1 Tax=Zongyangia hominis TaxID=2763677 RepID=A0A926IC77_9FIRM|nr:alpha/beta hydrolase [Zongyangia hominis]MBC8570825.1 alpha/beta hydrolase [Zongyangia hominis]